jgi:hypothetical protein
MKLHTLIALAPAGLLALGLGGCAAPRAAQSPEARSAELLSHSSAPARRHCRIVETPAQVPDPAMLVDVEGLAADLAALPLQHTDSVRYALLSMGYDRFGANIRRDLIEHTLPVAVADSVQKLVFKHRRPVDESDGDWGVRLRLTFDEPLRLETGRQEFCAPRPRDSALALAMETTVGSGTRLRNGLRERTVWVRLFVDSRGTVTNATIERGIVPNSNLEWRIFEHVRTYFFEPALADGRPVTGTVSIPVVVRER